MNRTEKQKTRETAKNHISEYFTLANLANDPALAQKYIKLAKELASKQNVRFSKIQRMQYCRNCHSFLKPGLNCTIRKNSYLSITCYNCHNIARY